jgi:hypothetical protein
MVLCRNAELKKVLDFLARTHNGSVLNAFFKRAGVPVDELFEES